MLPKRYKLLVIQLQRWYARRRTLVLMVRFLRANWFWIGLVCLIGFGVYRKRLNINIGSTSPSATEKFTQAPAAGGGTTQMTLMSSSSGLVSMQAVDEATAKAFLIRFGKVTKAEQQKFGLPGTAMLALAYVNSFGGQRQTVGEARNYFALACGGGWTSGGTDIGGKCYRVYATPWESFRDASTSIKAQPWCQEALKNQTDWKGWVRLFADNGCSDVANAHDEMVRIIERYKLWEL
jgi:hypothetical protein